MSQPVKLYTYFRSSAAWRVRIALNLKGLGWEAAPLHLLRDGGEQHAPGFRAINPLGLVPALETGGGAVLTQSLAIIEWLEETHPDPPLLPRDPLPRARVRAFALTIACGCSGISSGRWASRNRRSTIGTATGSPRDCRRWKRCWRAMAATGRIASGRRQAWPTCCWCRNWPMRGGLAFPWKPVRCCCAPMRPPATIPPSWPPPPRRKPILPEYRRKPTLPEPSAQADFA